MLENNFSLVIQGRLHKHSLSRLQKYRSSGFKIIYSYRDDDNTNLLNEYDITGVEFVTYPKEVADTTFNLFNTYYHCNSTYTGLKKVSTPYSIKLRSDNYIGNLLPLMDKLMENKDKYVTGNLYFRPDNVQKFCPCDQVIAARTDLLSKAFEIACFRMENHSKELREGFNDWRQVHNTNYIFYSGFYGGCTVPGASVEMPRGQGVSPEVLLGTSWLAAKRVVPDPAISRQQMIENFEIVRLEDMKPYLGKDGTSLIPHAGSEISRIEDI